MPSFNKCPGGWRVQVRLSGQQSRSKTFPTKAQAVSWANQIESEVKDCRRGVIKATLQDAFDKYIKDVSPTLKSGDNITKRLKALAKMPGMLPMQRQLAEVTAVDLSKFRDKRSTEVSVATVRKEMTIIRSVLESARRDWSMISVNPIADVKRPPAPPNRKRLMLDGERDRLLIALGYEGRVETVQHQVAVAMLLGLETAMRAGEMLGLTWDRVNLKKKYVSLEKTKNGDYRDVPLSNRAVELLESMRMIDAHKVFTVTVASLDVLFRKARDRCEIDNLHFHDTRATALTNLSSKLDVMELARMVGHRDLKSLLVYYRKSATDLANKLG